jgi:hypothetical protein
MDISRIKWFAHSAMSVTLPCPHQAAALGNRKKNDQGILLVGHNRCLRGHHRYSLSKIVRHNLVSGREVEVNQCAKAFPRAHDLFIT